MLSLEKNEPFQATTLPSALPSKKAERSRFLRGLSKQELLNRTRELASEERRIGLELLWHLHQIDRRRLAEEMGFSGVFDYCVKVLHLSEGSAFRRVQAMRALRATPEIADALKDGRLNVTTASQIQTFLQRSKRAGISDETLQERIRSAQTSAEGASSSETAVLTPNDPMASPPNLFTTLQGLSGREVERRLAELVPELPRIERERAISDSEIEIRVTLSTQTRTKWSRIQQLAAHRLRFDTSNRRLIELTTDVTLDSLEKEKGLNTEPKAKPENAPQPDAPLTPPKTTTRAIPAAIRRFVWRRDEGCCRYFDPETGKRCVNRFGLEIDHVRPWSLGGNSYDSENLRLLCAAHHRMMTERTFGKRITYTASESSA